MDVDARPHPVGEAVGPAERVGLDLRGFQHRKRALARYGTRALVGIEDFDAEDALSQSRKVQHVSAEAIRWCLPLG